MNKPVSRVRSIALLAVVIMGHPLYMLFNHLYFYGKVETPSFIDTTIIFIALCLLSYVLLGNNRSRTLTAASFIFSIINLAQFPVVYFTAVFIHPVNDLSDFLEDSMELPQLYFGSIFFINIVITVCCLLAARWLRNTKLKPPLNIYVPFNLMFIIFTFIVLFWLEDFSLVSMSFLSSFFMGSLIIVILIFLFYLYTRLTADNSSSAVKNTETQISTAKNDKYTPFIQLLSRRELEVIESILAGNVRYKELSKALNISVNTVKTHLKHIYQTTGVSNIAGLSSLFYGYTSNHP
jgi:DNA-binding CsgD family transcriptional regulator/glucan phosphoethanolaminetransferase (alkaline phosphatase superfamily)